MIVKGLMFLYNVNQSLEMDEKAQKKYAKAIDRNGDADYMVQKKIELADKRLANVVKKKRAILQYSVPEFVKVYSEIQKIELQSHTLTQEISIYNSTQDIARVDNLCISVKQEFTDKELISGLITKGFGKMIVMDSERYLSAATNTLRSANVAYSQAESISAVYDAIVKRADRIANLLMAMNALFVRSIKETSDTIKRNGYEVRKYSTYDKEVLMTCVNMAAAMSDLVNIPVLDEKGEISEAAADMLSTGEHYLNKMRQIING